MKTKTNKMDFVKMMNESLIDAGLEAKFSYKNKMLLVSIFEKIYEHGYKQGQIDTMIEVIDDLPKDSLSADERKMFETIKILNKIMG